MERYNLYVTAEDNGKRLDIYLTQKLGTYSRSYIKSLINDGMIQVHNSSPKANYRVKTGDNIQVMIPPPKEISLLPEAINLDIVYEDDDIIVINKKQGMVVHPAPGNYSGTLVNALLYHCDQLSSINGEIRPGIVHRIDKDTSGLLVSAKNDRAHKHLAQQIQQKKVMRVYWAIVEKNMKQEKGTINAPIVRHPLDRKKMTVIDTPRSREAITHFFVLERYGSHTLIEARLETGRTHQIRVHMAYIGHPVLGDLVYGSKKQPFGLEAQLLHAKKLGLIHPSTLEYMEFTAPLPESFERVMERLRQQKNMKS